MSLATVRTLGYAVLPCRDLAGMRAFYADTLGLPVSYERADWIKFATEGAALVLRPFDAALFERHGTVQLAFPVSRPALDSCYDELKAKGVTIVGPPTDQAWGHRTVYFRDPEGNLLEIYSDL